MDAPRFANYCEACAAAAPGSVHRSYHDFEYGFPLASDDELFGRLVLEINQAGLSWETILKKKDAFFAAYGGFSVEAVAAYGKSDVDRLLGDAAIIRNRLKINATVENAKRILRLRSESGSFKHWLDSRHPLQKAEWVGLFKKTFLFTGGEITGEFLMSTGYLPGAHVASCPVYGRILESGAAWISAINKT